MKTTTNKRIAFSILKANLVAAIFAAVPFACNVSTVPLPNAPLANPFSGQAALVLSTVGGVSVTAADTGFLPVAGGTLETSLLDVNVPNLLTAQVGHSIVIGQGQTTRAESSLSKLDLNLAGHRVTLDFLLSKAIATCKDGVPAVSGGAVFSKVVVDGQEKTIGTNANIVVELKNEKGEVVGKITFNEQLPVEGDGGNSRGLIVTALRIQIFGSADTSIGRAFAAIKCAPPAPVSDFVTGGGFIETSGFAANFGLAAGIKEGTPWGHLVYIDHGTDLKVKATSVTAYQIVNPVTRRFEGTCEVNQVGGATFTVEVVDNGEPGNTDTFRIDVSNGYTAQGTLVGGNIQIHN